jgi:hypothetical protein
MFRKEDQFLREYLQDVSVERLTAIVFFNLSKRAWRRSNLCSTNSSAGRLTQIVSSKWTKPAGRQNSTVCNACRDVPLFRSFHIIHHKLYSHITQLIRTSYILFAPLVCSSCSYKYVIFLFNLKFLFQIRRKAFG